MDMTALTSKQMTEAGANVALHVSMLETAIRFAVTSPDPSTQNAAFIVVNDAIVSSTMAVNQFPRGVAMSEGRWGRPIKYSYVEHAERNAIYAAARHGVKTDGATMYAVWAACADCARAIIQSGISTLVRYTSTNHAHWGESINVADEMLLESGIQIVTVDSPIVRVPALRRDGKPWFPDGPQRG